MIVMFILTAITIGLGFIFLKFRRKSNGKPLPGPNKTFIESEKMNSFTKLHILLDDLSKTYGGVYKIRLHDEPIVVLSSFDAIHDALVRRGSDFAGRPSTYRTEHSDRHKNSIVWQTYTPKLRILRKNVQRHLKTYGDGLDELHNKCLPEIQTMICQISNMDGRLFDPRDLIYPAVCNIMILLLLGKQLDQSDPAFSSVMEINSLFNETFSSGDSRQLDCAPISEQAHTEPCHKLHHALKLRDEFCAQHLFTGLESDTSSTPDCIVKNLIELQQSCDTADITDDTVKEVFTNMLLAGTDTTVTALQLFLLVMLHKPEIQDRLHNEIDSVIGDSPISSLSIRHKMPYTESMLLELLRYVSHVPLAVPHHTIRDTDVQGYFVPANTTVYINLWSLHHDDTLWDNPWEFQPDRFLDANGALLPSDSPRRRHLMPFGAGRRVCLGETLAKNRLFLFAVTLLQQFTFLPDPAAPLPTMDPRTFDMGIVIHPQRFQLQAIPRKTH